MDVGTCEQFPVSRETVGNTLPYLVENMIVTLLSDGDKPITVELPLFVEIRGKETEPAAIGRLLFLPPIRPDTCKKRLVGGPGAYRASARL